MQKEIKSEAPNSEQTRRSSHCSTAIFLKVCFQCSNKELPWAYAGRWVPWTHVPRVGDRIQWSEDWDDVVEAIYWHIGENAVEVIVTFDCDSTVEGLQEEGEEVSYASVYGHWLQTAYEAGFDYTDSSENAMTGWGAVPPRQ